jgi:hypothetical protein
MAEVTIDTLKPRFQALLRPVVGRLAALGITANQVTLAALLGPLAMGIAVVWSNAKEDGEHGGGDDRESGDQRQFPARHCHRLAS